MGKHFPYAISQVEAEKRYRFGSLLMVARSRLGLESASAALDYYLSDVKQVALAPDADKNELIAKLPGTTLFDVFQDHPQLIEKGEFTVH